MKRIVSFRSIPADDGFFGDARQQSFDVSVRDRHLAIDSIPLTI
jgi:hypothetical protein